jgi:hypothetical protein
VKYCFCAKLKIIDFNHPPNIMNRRNICKGIAAVCIAAIVVGAIWSLVSCTDNEHICEVGWITIASAGALLLTAGIAVCCVCICEARPEAPQRTIIDVSQPSAPAMEIVIDPPPYEYQPREYGQ